jgi:hypothetical protein
MINIKSGMDKNKKNIIVEWQTDGEWQSNGVCSSMVEKAT